MKEGAVGANAQERLQVVLRLRLRLPRRWW